MSRAQMEACLVQLGDMLRQALPQRIHDTRNDGDPPTDGLVVVDSLSFGKSNQNEEALVQHDRLSSRSNSNVVFIASYRIPFPTDACWFCVLRSATAISMCVFLLLFKSYFP